MKVSIITVCFNSENTIKKTIESVLGQTYGSIEYIIVDGASTDGTVVLAESYRNAFEDKGYEFKIISEKDNGIYDAMNKGVNLATGKIVGLINSSDWYEVDAVESVVDAYNQENFDMFFADLNLIKQNGKVVVKKSKFDRGLPVSRHWNHPTTFITKETYNELGAYRCEGLYDDFDLYLRIRKVGKKVVVKNKVLANFSMGGVSNDKKWSNVKKRCGYKYKCYRNNGYGKISWFESVVWEIAKWILG